ncbi:hypothetical protein KHS38_13470 [Mucilaginibacter sp. Bleaf8]|uniref:hypothetical protein n=1 Tax=Mucilaginibacter sp. Bleaf8 TaxID=2834430 RepID=UPI001BCBED9E|nr:hypothetical protein [Mucilaginibacter sp. Bleaf8]MBS7565415.1 hypothetical protein [Mucilaginibacter sp. Bleaf8]
MSRILAAALLCAVLMLGMHACKTPTDNLDLIVNTSALAKSPVLVRLVNANASSTTSIPNNVAVSISGPGAGLVQVDGGGTNFTASNGILPLSLTKSANVSPGNPVTFTLYVAVNGFAPTSKTITLTSNDVSTVVLPLVEYAHPVDGTAATVKTNAISAGTTSAINVNTTASGSTTEASSISIPAGTELQDANGAVISSSQLKTSVVYFGTTNTNAYSAFPGGFDATNAIGPNGQKLTAGGSFVTAGLMSINMVAGNTEVKHFSKPVTVRMQINQNLVNPQTHQKVKTGDIIPIWSLNEKTGQWTYEGTSAVAQDEGGKLVTTFQITHLSAWSANWYGSVCSSPLTINLRIPNISQPVTGDYQIALVTANNQPVNTLNLNEVKDGYTTTVTGVPAGMGDLKVIVYSRSNGELKEIGETAAFSACEQGSVNVTLNIVSVPSYIKTNIKITARCTNKQVVAYPSAWLTIKDVTTGTTTSVYMADGLASSNLIDGHSYSINTVYSGKTYNSAAFKLDKSSGVTIPEVDGLSGTTSYSSATNTIDVDATFMLTDCN